MKRKYRIVENRAYNKHPDDTPYADTLFVVQTRWWFFPWEVDTHFKTIEQARKYISVLQEIRAFGEVEIK